MTAAQATGSTSERLAGIQILRGVAALMVTWHHAIEEAEYSTYAEALPKWLLLFGASGVDVFFVLSGFIMMYVTYGNGRRPEAPLSFFMKRSIRIYPFFWFCCLVTLALWGAGLYRSKVINPETVTRSLLLVPQEHLLITASWTLVYEMYFYCIFGLTLLLRSKKASVVVTTASILLLNGLSGFLPDPTLATFLGNEVAFEFCFGLLIGWACTTGRSSSARLGKQQSTGVFVSTVSAALCLIALAGVYLPADGTGSLDEPWRFIGWGVPAAMLVVAAIDYRPSQGWWATWGMRMGDASYAIYLMHGFLMTGYAKALRLFPDLAERRQWPLITLVIAASLVGGYLAHRLVELPLTRVVRSTFGRAFAPRAVRVGQ